MSKEKKEWSISLKKEFYKDIFGIVLFPLLLTIFAVIVFFIYLPPTVQTVRDGGKTVYSDQVADFYRTDAYNDLFEKSSAKEDNLLIVYLVNDEGNQFYCMSKLGANVSGSVTKLFGNEESEFGKIVKGSMDEQFKDTFSGSLCTIVDSMGDKIQALNLSSPFTADSDKSALAESKVINKSSLSVSEIDINASLVAFTEDTGIPAVIVIDEIETVFGKRMPVGDIALLAIVAIVAVISVTSTVKKVITRIRFEKNPQLFYKPTIYDANDNDENY